jgi:Mor family transcriptional regulator
MQNGAAEIDVKKLPSPYDDIFRAMQENHVDNDTARRVLKSVADSCGGREMYFPHKSSVFRNERNKEILERSSTENAHTIARDYGLSTKYVEMLIARLRKEAAAKSEAE